MRRSEEIREQFMPWAGLASAVIGAGIAHQFGSEGTFDSCTAISPVPLLIVSIACLLLTAFGAFESWRVLREDPETPVRKLVAIVSVGAGGLFVMAMILPMIACLVIPPCYQ